MAVGPRAGLMTTVGISAAGGAQVGLIARALVAALGGLVAAPMSGGEPSSATAPAPSRCSRLSYRRRRASAADPGDVQSPWLGRDPTRPGLRLAGLPQAARPAAAGGHGAGLPRPFRVQRVLAYTDAYE
jgi:hypothetical protein